MLRGVRPFLSDKYDLTKHPNYKYTADADKKYRFDMERYMKRKPAIVKPDEPFEMYELTDNGPSITILQNERKYDLWIFSQRIDVLQTLVIALGGGLACGAASTSWKVTARTTRPPMLMYGKEASNRKQEIDRQHYTIPNQRPKDKHCGKI